MHNKKIFNFFKVFICIILAFSFTGCSLMDFDVRNMMEAPLNDADMMAVKGIIDTGSRSDYCYPQKGEYREAVIFKSFTGNGSKDALALTYDASKRINISFFAFSGGEWNKSAEFTDKSDRVERVVFGDITGDGIQDVIIGFTNSEDKNQISVFSYSKETGRMEQISTKFYYTFFLCTNFKSSDRDELCVIKIEEGEENKNTAVFSVYSFSNGKFYAIGSITGSEKFETRLTTIENAFFDKDADGKNYVAVEGKSIRNTYITQLFTENKYTERFYSPYSANIGRNSMAEFERSLSSGLFSMDIDGDGIMEIPFMTQPQMANSTSAGYITDWVKPAFHSLSKEIVMSTVVNIEENYYFPIREEDRNSVVYYKGSDEDSLDVYYIESNGDTMEKAQKLFTVRTFTKPQWKEYTDKEYSDYTLVLNSRGDAVFAVKDLYECESSQYMLSGFSCIK